jgi:hypothetical protein
MNKMYNLTQYISAALHDGAINPQTIIDDYENKHKAKVVEVGINRDKIYHEAKMAKDRNNITSFLMIFPAFYIVYTILDSGFWDATPGFLFAAFIIFCKQFFIDSKLDDIANNESEYQLTTNNQNVIISGNYSPFIGYGNDLDSWSFTINFKKPSSNSESTSKISIEEISNCISNEIKRNIHNALITDKIFVNGKDIRHNSLFMSSVMSEPIVNVSQDIVNKYITNSDTNIRHYRHIEIPMWNSQVSLSIFLRFTIQGDQLFFEARYFLLPPIKSNLMILDDALSRTGFSYYRNLAIQSLFKSLFYWISGFILLLTWFSNIQIAISEAIFGNVEDKIKRKSETYNYGRNISIREFLSGNTYHRYFQMLDKDQGYKISQYIITNTIIDYLELKGISTEDIKQRQTTIINSGVIVNGGTVKAEQMSVGLGATLKNTVNRFTPK